MKRSIWERIFLGAGDFILDEDGIEQLRQLKNLHIIRLRRVWGPGFYITQLGKMKEVGLEEPYIQGHGFASIEDFLYIEGVNESGKIKRYNCYPYSKENLANLRRIVDSLPGKKPPAEQKVQLEK